MISKGWNFTEVGMAMGSFAQGFRFAITLILNMTLQNLGGLIMTGQPIPPLNTYPPQK